jgi:hypothetical protein
MCKRRLRAGVFHYSSRARVTWFDRSRKKSSRPDDEGFHLLVQHDERPTSRWRNQNQIEMRYPAFSQVAESLPIQRNGQGCEFLVRAFEFVGSRNAVVQRLRCFAQRVSQFIGQRQPARQSCALPTPAIQLHLIPFTEFA